MRWLAVLLAALLAAPAPAAARQGAVSLLNIVIVEGEGAINNIRQRTAREPVVQVEDENRKPVAGAAVTFTLPARGAGGAFPGGNSVTVLTDENGRAVARGLRPNNVKGKFEIRVNASKDGARGSTTITQTNLAGAAAAGGATVAGVSLKTLLIVGAIAGAAVAGGVVAATRGGDSSPVGGGATTISPGAGTVGPPR